MQRTLLPRVRAAVSEVVLVNRQPDGMFAVFHLYGSEQWIQPSRCMKTDGNQPLPTLSLLTVHYSSPASRNFPLHVECENLSTLPPFGLGTSESIRRIFSMFPSPRFIPFPPSSSSNVSHESERTRMRPQDYLPTATARKGNNDRRSTGEPGQLQLTQTTPKSRKKRGTTPTISENRFERVLHCAVKAR